MFGIVVESLERNNSIDRNTVRLPLTVLLCASLGRPVLCPTPSRCRVFYDASFPSRVVKRLFHDVSTGRLFLEMMLIIRRFVETELSGCPPS